MKICKHCIHYEQTSISEIDFSTCARVPLYQNPVTGALSKKYEANCNIQRQADFVEALIIGACGISGRWFERNSEEI